MASDNSALRQPAALKCDRPVTEFPITGPGETKDRAAAHTDNAIQVRARVDSRYELRIPRERDRRWKFAGLQVHQGWILKRGNRFYALFVVNDSFSVFIWQTEHCVGIERHIVLVNPIRSGEWFRSFSERSEYQIGQRNEGKIDAELLVKCY